MDLWWRMAPGRPRPVRSAGSGVAVAMCPLAVTSPLAVSMAMSLLHDVVADVVRVAHSGTRGVTKMVHHTGQALAAVRVVGVMGTRAAMLALMQAC